MTKQEFVDFCLRNNLSDQFIITEGYFCSIRNIIGCNKVEDSYIVYSTNTVGAIHKIAEFDNEYYTFRFLFLIIKNYLELEYGKEKIKEFKI